MKSAGKTVVGAGRPEVTSDLFNETVDEFIAVGNYAPDSTKTPRQQPEEPHESDYSTEVLRQVIVSNAPATMSERKDGRSLDSSTKSLILNAASEVSEKNNGIIKGGPLHESMKMIMPGFDYRDLGFGNFTDMLSLHDGLIVKGKGSPGDITVTVKSS